MNFFRFFTSSLLLFTLSFLSAKPPELEIEDVKETLSHIMEAHVSHKKFTPDLIKRAVEGYLELLDPTKTYFLAYEVKPWLEAGEADYEQFTAEIENNDFSIFDNIHAALVQAIARRERIESEIKDTPLDFDVSVNEFKDLNWVDREEDLKSRLLKIKALQMKAADKLSDESKEKAMQRIAKRRSSFEEEITTKDPKLKKQVILSNVLSALAGSFDTHTAYFTPNAAKQFLIQVQQRLFGVGAQLRDNIDGFLIIKIIEGGPASQSDLKVDDLVIAIEEEPVVGMSINDVVELIRGEEGTKVTLTVVRKDSEGNESTLKVPITRGEVVLKEARIESASIPFGDGVIAHIKLHAFYQDPQYSSARDLADEIVKIKKEHKLKGVILDLRHNAGGVLPQAVAVTGLFITKGIVVSIKDNLGNLEHLRDIEGKTSWDGPLLVLTSKLSASAAEIVAQTLQDYGRALVVGDPHTYGKGTFQTFTLDASKVNQVNPKGEFKVTRGRYYTVSGKSPQLTGVVPDIVIPGPFAEMEIGEKYAKYALENDAIEPNFNDDLSDIPPFQREQAGWLYKFNLQPRLKTFTRFLPTLTENSKKRIEDNELYKRFVEELAKEDKANPSQIELFIKADPQLSETVNVMKDLILLCS